MFNVFDIFIFKKVIYHNNKGTFSIIPKYHKRFVGKEVKYYMCLENLFEYSMDEKSLNDNFLHISSIKNIFYTKKFKYINLSNIDNQQISLILNDFKSKLFLKTEYRKTKIKNILNV